MGHNISIAKPDGARDFRAIILKEQEEIGIQINC